ncbi:MAG: SRPBCC domain-containing protein [Sphingomonas sp.]|uniref:SRPBCC domain-containing protein n=1 Tax=Sphingomonas sp. TaxID=28214 RepID=UPI0025F852A4|nr:SRPBCC domain-containing protein [Sphingomonas sp.]MBX3563127.1 SRPBCC domain-containing protein [Sphingomonas sp.]
MSRTDAAFRVIAAAVDKLYAALIDPESLVRWLPPEGMTGVIEAFDPRPGGVYRIRLTYDDAEAAVGKTDDDSDVSEGEFVELVPNVRVVQRGTFESDDPTMAGTMTFTWRFDPVEDGTRVTVTAEGVPPGIRRKDHLDGLRSTLANLAAFAE